MGKEFSFGKTAAATLFALAESALFMPYATASNGVLISLIIAVPIAVLLYVFWYFLAGKIFESKKKSLSVYIYCGVIITASLFSAGLTSFGFVRYLSEEILVKSIRFTLVAVMAGLIFYVIKCGEKAVLKFSVVAFWFCILCIILTFLISIPNFNAEYFVDLVKGKTGEIFTQTVFIFLRVFSATALFAPFSRFVVSQKSSKQDILGIFMGGGLLIFCLLNGVLTFSLKMATEMKFAYPTSIGVINLGNLFTRMDGFTYFLFFFSCFVKTAICGITVKFMLNKAGVKKADTKAGFLTAAVIIASYIF